MVAPVPWRGTATTPSGPVSSDSVSTDSVSTDSVSTDSASSGRSGSGSGRLTVPSCPAGGGGTPGPPGRGSDRPAPLARRPGAGVVAGRGRRGDLHALGGQLGTRLVDVGRAGGGLG